MAEDLPEGRHVPRCLITVVCFGFPVKDSEKVVVRSSDEFPIHKSQGKYRLLAFGTTTMHSLQSYANFSNMNTCDVHVRE